MRMVMLDMLVMRRSFVSSLAICLAISVFISATTGSGAGGLTFAVMLPYMYVMTLFSFDEAYGWERLRLSMPLTRRDVVLGRYLGVLLVVVVSCAAGAAVGMALYALVDLFSPGDLDIPFGVEGMQVVLGGTFVGLLLLLVMFSLLIPLYTKFGTTKGRWLTMLVTLSLVCVSMGVIASFAQDDGGIRHAATTIATTVPLPVVVGLSTAVALALYAVSAVVSMRLYAGKEL